MNLIIISGFLGSGKTSLLVPLAKRLVEKGKKLVIIENEVGKVGIDDQYLSHQGLIVRELYSGCACCQLRVDLLNTLYDIERTLNPDVVIMEPSGVACPHLVLEGLIGYGGNLDRKIVLFLVDAVRFQAIELLSLPMVEMCVGVADLVVLNKIDGVTDNHLAFLHDKIRGMKSSVPVFPVSALAGSLIEPLLEALEAQLSQPEVPVVPQMVQTDNFEKPIPTIHARKVDLTFTSPVSSDLLVRQIRNRLNRFVADLQAAGCSLIGHIKAILQPREGGYLLFNITNFGEPPITRGGIPKNTMQAVLTLNAIVYGLDSILLSEKAGTFFNTAWTDEPGSS